MKVKVQKVPAWKNWFRNGALVALILLLAQVAYYIVAYDACSTIPANPQLVLVYSGGDDRTGIGRIFSGHTDSPLFLFSGWDYSRAALEKSLHLGDRILLEPRARTTDQNARYSAPILKKLGVHSVVLALPWYHLPRALFLTRLYLLGSGIHVTPYATIPLPRHWWMDPNFYLELVKFWGSLGRVVLSWFGIVDWPRPQLIQG